MSGRRRTSRKHDRRRPGWVKARAAVNVRKIPGGDFWELVHPRCARDRAEDLEEVRHMIDMGEIEIAVDELRWLLSGCSDFIEAHRLLGELALAEGEVRLARGHFGYAYQLGVGAIDARKISGTLPYARPANQAFFESAKGLAHCLVKLGKPELARDVLQRVLRLDPADPLSAAGQLAAIGSRNDSSVEDTRNPQVSTDARNR